MPGKQMAIGADLSSGLSNDDPARKRRDELSQESGFFGSMDGASTFVRGDAIAGLIITVINVVGGMIIGMAQQGLSFADASMTYTLLTVRDRLVSQIPALLTSPSARMPATKRGAQDSPDPPHFAPPAGHPHSL